MQAQPAAQGPAAFLALLLLLLILVLLPIVALYRLRAVKMDEIARAIWAVFIVLVPIAGPLAYFIVSPGGSGRGQTGESP